MVLFLKPKKNKDTISSYSQSHQLSLQSDGRHHQSKTKIVHGKLKPFNSTTNRFQAVLQYTASNQVTYLYQETEDTLY